MLDIESIRDYKGLGEKRHHFGAMKNQNKTGPQEQERVIVHYELVGEDARRFMEERRLQHISNNAELGRKFYFERLEQIDAAREKEKVA